MTFDLDLKTIVSTATRVLQQTFLHSRYREQRARERRNRKSERGASRGYSDDLEKQPRGRSQSLDAILEELYFTETEGEDQRAFIPRAKLNAQT